MTRIKLLLVSDIHGNRKFISQFKEVITSYDPNVILISGDITDFGDIDEAESILSELSYDQAVNIFVPGNCDPPEILYIDRVGDFLNIHSRSLTVSDLKFFGVGGGLISPFDTYIEFSDEELRNYLKPLERPFVLVTHTPPHNTSLDIIWNGSHIGSKVIREYIETYQPNLVVSGHIHEARGIDYIGATIIVNPGPSKKGYYAEAEYSEGEFNISLRRL